MVNGDGLTGDDLPRPPRDAEPQGCEAALGLRRRAVVRAVL